MEMSGRVWQYTLALLLLCLFALTDATYTIGVGRADCTGPSAEITFMGYAKLSQKGCGIHLRQYARAYIFDDGNKRGAFVTVDACMMNHGVRKAVLEKLEKQFRNTYTIDNLILSGTHTHSTPGGFMMDVMLDIPNLGFVRETFDALVDGIVRAIERAHHNMVEARIYVSSGELLKANINRSPASYMFNPLEERNRYKYNVDKDMVQLRFERVSDEVTFGAINWFAVHPTSMNNTNCLVTSDNVGYASILLESAMDDALPGKSNFVGAFASTNLGDVSPNIKGPKCINTGEPCEHARSTCDGEAKFCIASGPGGNMVESTKIIANRLFGKAKELLSDPGTREITGELKYIHQFVSMPNETALIQLPDGTTEQVRGCRPGMGYSFAAGTTDGPGEFDFTQATNTTNAFWNLVRDFIFPPSPDDVSCHAPKPILIMSGNIKLPYEWQPEVVATQIFMIGNVVLAAVPGEFTTMSGRRLRQAIKEQIVAEGGPSDSTVIIAGLSNVYTNYIATPEEYELQRYEGASTIYGPHTLTIYLKIYRNLVTSMIQNKALPPQPQPYEFPDKLLTLVTPVLFDTSGWFLNFGDCLKQPPKSVKTGRTVSATFISGHPRNNLMHEDTFLTIERLEKNNWIIVATDSSWETRFIWRRTGPLKGSSEVDIRWTIDRDTKPGTYRIRHFGYYKYIFGGIYPYEGQSRTFTVTQ